MWGAKPLTRDAVLSMAGDKSVPPVWIRLHPQQREVGSTVPGTCCVENKLCCVVPSPRRSETPLAPMEALMRVARGALQVGKPEAPRDGALA